MVRLQAFRKTMAILAVALGYAVIACLLPENTYQRWQLLDGTIYTNSRWIYERCRFDPTPIDVVFLGPSRTMAGVNAPLLGRALAAQGLPSHVVNFSLPETGRNINFAIAEELFAYKRPKLVILGVTEKPSRFGHSTFKYLADRADIVKPEYLVNMNYFSDLIYLPFRTLQLFAADIMPGGMGLAKEFDAGRFRGDLVDTTGTVVLPGGKIKNNDAPASVSELARGIRKLELTMHPPILPAVFADLEFGDERHYVGRITDLAEKRGARVAFLFLPYYGGPGSLQEQRFYDRFGPTLNAAFLAPHAEWFSDYGHLTRQGARVLTDWLVAPVTSLLTKTGSKG